MIKITILIDDIVFVLNLIIYVVGYKFKKMIYIIISLIITTLICIVNIIIFFVIFYSKYKNKHIKNFFISFCVIKSYLLVGGLIYMWNDDD